MIRFIDGSDFYFSIETSAGRWEYWTEIITFYDNCLK